ncbi:RCC1 domain-containing protein [Vulgatibacter incomptus]|uniref:ATP-dependent DNA helicase UvrD/PcrA n=1 Tax=Vulgatibacter incomptus TaxID=1391653 RepID=A0A0K1P929_9BACT|nr:hypothetical protein [Vulgatibacter incomptus]AKU89921.1 ATP-dependent DNA helicase UvrD/PcrA [Vulgatibacter incomptus]
MSGRLHSRRFVSPLSHCLAAVLGTAAIATGCGAPLESESADVPTGSTNSGLTTSYIDLVAGDSHTCALAANGQAYCWGTGANGELGAGKTTVSNSGIPVSGRERFKSLTAGLHHVCGVSDSGTFCWGKNDAGQLGTGDYADRNAPSTVTGGHSFTGLRAGAAITCALDGSEPWCWGDRAGSSPDPVPAKEKESSPDPVPARERMSSPDPVPARTSSPDPVPARGFGSLRVGRSHVCGLGVDGGLFCFGDNERGQIAWGLSSPDPVPAFIGVWGPDSNGVMPDIRTFALGAAHSCATAVENGKSVTKCWGDGKRGQLGNGSYPVDPSGRVTVSGNVAYVSLVTGENHTCGLASNGDVWCWGSNEYGQLGDGTSVDRSANPVRTKGPAFQALAAGRAHTCGIATDGQVYCWGRNNELQLGIGSGQAANVPTKVSIKN